MRSTYRFAVHVCLACLIGLPFLFGCEKRRERQEAILGEDDSRFVLAIVLDMSGSFAQLMAEEGKGYEFAMLVIDRYFRDRIGTRDKIVFAQISGADRKLLWEGTATALRQEFPSANAFRQFLMTKADPSRSLVYDGITQSVDYVLSDPGISSGKAKSALFVLSDMLDTGTGPNADESKQKAKDALASYGRHGGIVGLYYVDLNLVREWRQILQDAGIQHYSVQSEIVGKPNLPSFE